MSGLEVSEPILNSPYEEPEQYWYIQEGEQPIKKEGRRPSLIFPPRDQKIPWTEQPSIIRKSQLYPTGFELELVNDLRGRVKQWRKQGWPGASRTTLELLQYWRREGRDPHKRLFFAQLEAAETIIFLKEARADFRQGIRIPRDEPGESQKAEGYIGFERLACKMATGGGKTTVMGMLAAWSILNKVATRGDARFSDVILVLCPNVTIRSRLQELDPELDEASLYRTRDLVPPHLMPQLRQGRVLVTNWHVFQPQTPQVGDVGGKVLKMGRAVKTTETIHIGPKNTTARGKRYLTLEELNRQVATGLIEVEDETHDPDGTLKQVKVVATRYVESDTSLVERVLGREVGGKQNILVMNDEAHHAYRIIKESDEAEEELFGEDEEAEEFYKEATVWIEGLDKIHKLRGVNFCVDLSATPYYLGRVGQETNKPFPWVASDFGLIEAIESGLVKIPQLAVRDTTGAEIPGYFNIWKWIIEEKLTSAERGGRKGSPKPEAILKYAYTPMAMLGSLWEEQFKAQSPESQDPRPPVFIIVCKNTRIAKVVYEWIAEDKSPTGIPPCKLESFRNRDGETYTIRVDSKVVHETDTDGAKSDEALWMRLTLDTVGKREWPIDRQGRPIYPEGFEELVKKLERSLTPPGRDVRCIVSVGMLTEGWDCNTVAHIIGLRPFMSQLLCEQVVGRGLRRTSYDLDEGTGLFAEEVAKVLGVPFEVIPFKANKQGVPPPKVKRYHIHAVPEKAHLEIRFPRMEGYTQTIHNRLKVDWDSVAPLEIRPGEIPPEVEVKGLSLNNQGRLSLSGPGKIDEVTLKQFRKGRRIQELIFDMARTFTKNYTGKENIHLPPHVLFPQLITIIRRYVDEKVRAIPPTDKKDLFLSPWYGWLIERLQEAIRPDADAGETPELPIYESNRGPGSTADVDYWTGKEVREVLKSHLNYVVADTKKWEQSATYYLDRHEAVICFVKNDGLGFAIPYLYNGQYHDYLPDFIVRLKGDALRYLILETKGFDPLEEVKTQATERWASAVNADGQYGQWLYTIVRKPEEVPSRLNQITGDLE
jgi:type III restriction enzyme